MLLLSHSKIFLQVDCVQVESNESLINLGTHMLVLGRGWSSGTRPFLKRVGALVRTRMSLFCLASRLGGQGGVNIVSLRVREGGGRMPARQKGSVKFGG